MRHKGVAGELEQKSFILIKVPTEVIWLTMAPTLGGVTSLSASVRHCQSRPLKRVSAKRRIAASPLAAVVYGQGDIEPIKVAAEITHKTPQQISKNLTQSTHVLRYAYSITSFKIHRSR